MKKPTARSLFGGTDALKLFIGQGVSMFGDMITMLAVPMMVYAITGSKAALSLTIFIRVLPILLLGPFAGALVDRLDRKKIMIASDLLRALLTVALIYAPDKYLVGTIYVVMCIKSIVGIFFGPAMNSTIPSIIEKDNLVKVNSFIGTVGNVITFVAPLCGAGLIGIFGPRMVLYIDMVSFVVSAAAIYLIKIPKLERHQEEKTGSPVQRLFSDMGQGFRIIAKTPVLIIMLITTAITQFGQGFISPLWLPYVVEVLKQPATRFTVLVSFQGLGSILGSAMLMVLGAKIIKNYKKFYSLLAMGVGLSIFLQITTVRFNIFIIWGTLVGVFISGWSITVQTIMQHNVKPEFMGRISSSFMIINQGCMLMAVIIAGVYSSIISTRLAFVLACSIWLVGCTVGALLMAFTKEKAELPSVPAAAETEQAQA